MPPPIPTKELGNVAKDNSYCDAAKSHHNTRDIMVNRTNNQTIKYCRTDIIEPQQLQEICRDRKVGHAPLDCESRSAK